MELQTHHGWVPNDVIMTSRSQKPLRVGGVAFYLHFFVMTGFV
jgi:hypothetical protein